MATGSFRWPLRATGRNDVGHHRTVLKNWIGLEIWTIGQPGQGGEPNPVMGMSNFLPKNPSSGRDSPLYQWAGGCGDGSLGGKYQ